MLSAAREASCPDGHTATQPDDPDEVVHIVGYPQYVLDRLGLRVPHALCGEPLHADPDRADPAELGAPVCPRCRRRSPNTPTSAMPDTEPADPPSPRRPTGGTP